MAIFNMINVIGGVVSAAVGIATIAVTYFGTAVAACTILAGKHLRAKRQSHLVCKCQEI